MKLAIPDMVSNSYFPALAAVELGLFSEEGLDIEIERIFPPDRAYAAMRDGAVDLVGASAHTALSAFPNWRGVKLLCAQSKGMYWFLVLHRDFGARRGELETLKGRSIGAAPWVELGLRRLLAEAGLDPVRDDIRIAPVKPNPAAGPNFGLSAARALEDRRVDGFWANGMAAEVALRRGVGTVVLDVRRGDGPRSAFHYTMPTVAASDPALQEHPDLAGAVVRAMAKTHAALAADLSIAARVGDKLFPPEEAGLIAELIRRDLPFYDATISEEEVRNLNGFARDMGLLSEDVPYEAVVAAPGRSEAERARV